MKREKRRILRGHIVMMVAAVIVVLFVGAIVMGRLDFLPTAPTYETSSNEELLVGQQEITGHAAQEKASKEVASDSRVARWNEDGVFFAKARYDIDQTERDYITYEVALRIDVETVTATTNADIERKVNLLLWRIARESLVNEDTFTATSRIVVILYLFVGDVPMQNSNRMYVFPASRYADILNESDPEKITVFAGKPKPVIPSIPNVGPLWEPPSLIPNQ